MTKNKPKLHDTPWGPVWNLICHRDWSGICKRLSVVKVQVVKLQGRFKVVYGEANRI